jgi:hypothetical protein
MSDLTNRLRKGFDFLCREKQIDSYQAISNEAADKMDGLEDENETKDKICIEQLKILSKMKIRIEYLEKREDELQEVISSYRYQINGICE